MQCLCQRGFFGVTCEHKFTCGNCDSYECNQNKNCKKCPKGFSGEKCDTKSCHGLDMCNKNGNKYF